MSEKSAGGLPRILSRDCTTLSQWVSLETISVLSPGSPEKPEVFHAFRQADYVHVLAMTVTGLFVLVRQYRPVIESWTLELPGGLREAGEDPGATATRELREESGLAALEVIPLIDCYADVGRLRNRFYGFFALAEPVGQPEKGLSAVLLSGEELRASAVDGRIAQANHLALLYLAAVHPRVRELCLQYGQVPPSWN